MFGDTSAGAAGDSRSASDSEGDSLVRRRSGLGDSHSDPMEAMGNLFDVAILIGLGFLIMSLTSMGLKEIVSAKDVTVIKNPGRKDMEIITKRQGEIRRFQATDQQVQGEGTEVGSVYRLSSGALVWVKDGAATSAPEPTP